MGSSSDYSSRLLSLLASKDRDFLLTPDNTEVKISEIQGNVIGIYFSANWYTPCRDFNELLIKVYRELKGRGCNFEIVLVSSDEDIDAFNNYRAFMPWLSVPFTDLETRRSLSRFFDVEAIPCLVIIQPKNSNNNNNDENVEMCDGVELIYRYGVRSFPFTKARLDELVKEEWEKEAKQTIVSLLTNQARDYLSSHLSSHQVPVTSLEGKTIELYFSAQWCLPCVKFTPKLISIYQRIKQNLLKTRDNFHNEEFEIIFVSNDRDKASFDTYFETMPWLALPFGDTTIKELASHFNIRDIPSLVILGPDGKTLTKQGRNLINLYQENAYPFTEARLELIEKEMEKEAKNLPKSTFHEGHQHELSLVSKGTGGGPFICCDCDEQGSNWAYQCLECGFEVHTKCARPLEQLYA